ncbi:MAG: hypothetical protein FJX71_02995 [Alphaproteobacteria bacterium]|nr:hypothetical protein [Alphaproteobacteria bacterium]
MKQFKTKLIILLSVFGFLSPLAYGQAFTPEKLLPPGIDSTTVTNPYTGEQGTARKGTVAATLNNVALLNKFLLDKDSKDGEEAVQAIKQLIPSLKCVGIFNLFTPMEWLTTPDQPGRILAVALLLQAYPSEFTPEIEAKLRGLQEQAIHPILAQEIKKAFANKV